MTDEREHPASQGEPEPGPRPVPKEPWRAVYFGQVADDLIPYHPEPPEAPEDELTREAMADPHDVNLDQAHRESAPTLWRVIVVVLVAVVALAIVFWR